VFEVLYKFGKLPKKIDKRTLQLKNFLVYKNLPLLPEEYNVDSEFIDLIDNNTYNNTVYGDCVIAGRAHMTLRFEYFEEGILISITDDEVINEYFKESGGLDTGLYMLNSLNEWRKNGWIANSKNYNIHAYAEIDINNHDELKYCVYLLRGAYTGFLVPQSAIDQFDKGEIWTVVSSNSPIVGGHCVYIVGYNNIGPICVTWGKKQQMTWEFWDKYFDEAYGVIDNTDEWIDPANDPLDIPKMDQQLSEITSSPPNPEPTPSPCIIGNTIAKIMSIFPYIGRRKGRFYYLNPPLSKKKNNIKNKILSFLPIISIGAGLMLQVFSMWQLDIMFVTRMWGVCETNIDFYKGLLQQGYWRWAAAHDFTINVEIFPTNMFTSGFWYDALMMMNILSWFLTALGVYSLHRKIQTLKNKLRLMGGE